MNIRINSANAARTLICALGLMAGAALAAEVEVKTLASDAPAATATLADFAGLVGNWGGPLGAAGFSAPLGGQMVGHLVLLNPDKSTRVEELWIIRAEGAHVLVRQKHYNPALKAREDNDQWAERQVVAVDPDHIYLNNLTWVTGGHTLRLLVRIPASKTAAEQRLDFSFKRVK